MTSSRRHRPDKGTALVEFALVLPVFALMLFAMVQFGLVFTGWAQLRNAVQTEARMAATGSVGSDHRCGQTDPTELLICEIAVRVGSPIDLNPTPAPSMPIPSDVCDQGLSSCSTVSWLDGNYIYENGTWEQIVAAGSQGPGQISDEQALTDGTGGPWTCDPGCTQLMTNVQGDGTYALASDPIAIVCEGSCQAGNQLVVCAQLTASLLTGFVPNMNVSTTSSFYLERDLSISPPSPPSGMSCG
jgi:hypothetical protein